MKQDLEIIYLCVRDLLSVIFINQEQEIIEVVRGLENKEENQQSFEVPINSRV